MSFFTPPDPQEPAPWYELGPTGPEPLFYVVDLTRPRGASVRKGCEALSLPAHCLWWTLPSALSTDGFTSILGATIEEVNDLREGWRVVRGGKVELHGKAAGAKDRLDEYFKILAKNPRPFCDLVVGIQEVLQDMGFDEISSLVQQEGGDPTLAAIALRHDLCTRRFKLLGDVEAALREAITLGESI